MNKAPVTQLSENAPCRTGRKRGIARLSWWEPLAPALVAGVVTGQEIDIGRAFLTKARLRFFRFTCDNRGKHTSLFGQQKLKPTVRYAGALPIANGLGRYGLAESCNLVRSVERFNDPASNFCPARTTLIEGLPLGCLICL